MAKRGRPKKADIIPPSESGINVRKFGGWKYTYLNGKMICGESVDDPNDPFVKLEKLSRKLDNLKEPSYHSNGRKKRVTNDLKQKINKTELAYDKLEKQIYEKIK